MQTNVIAETIAPSGAEEKDELETPEPEEPEEDENEQVVPALEEEPSEEEVKQASEKKSIPDEKQEEVSEEETVSAETTEETPVPRQPNPVEGETPKERALRFKINELREDARKKDELIKITPPPMDNKEYEALKEMYSDEELQNVEKLFDVIGKKKGYVKADEMYAQSGNEVLESFISKHPEYKPENDPEDVRWNSFRNILVKDYNREGKNPKELVRIFDKVYADVQEMFGEAKNTIAPKRNAEVQKVRSVSHTGGTKTEVSKKSNATTDPKVRAMFKDFDDEDF